MRQAVDAVMQGVELPEYAKDHPELATAIATWGIYGVDNYNKLYDIES